MVDTKWMGGELLIMQIYGYQKDEDTLIDLEEVSLQCTLEELDDIIAFLTKSREDHKAVAKKTSMCHSHLKDWNLAWRQGNPDIIVVTTNDKEMV